MSRAALAKGADSTTDPKLNIEQSKGLNATLKSDKTHRLLLWGSYESSSKNATNRHFGRFSTFLELSKRPNTHNGAAKTRRYSYHSSSKSTANRSFGPFSTFLDLSN